MVLLVCVILQAAISVRLTSAMDQCRKHPHIRRRDRLILTRRLGDTRTMLFTIRTPYQDWDLAESFSLAGSASMGSVVSGLMVRLFVHAKLLI